MSSSSPHIIRNQHIHATLNGTEREGFALQQKLTQLSGERLLPVLERVLSSCSPADKHLYIESLDVEAGTVSLEHIEEQLTGAVEQALGDALRARIYPTGRRERSSVESIQERSDEETHVNVLVHFLGTGLLPWWFRLPVEKTLEEMLLQSWEVRVGASLDALCDALQSATARLRLAKQFSQRFIESVLKRIQPGSERPARIMISMLRQAGMKNDELRLAEIRILEAAIRLAAAQKPVTEEAIIRAAFSSPPMPLPAESQFRTWIKQHWSEAGLTTSPLNATRSSNDVSSHTGDEIYVDNAGLVLLHPFLPRLFEALGIAQGEKMLLPDRALSVLHFLATGQMQAPEYNLALPKILCGQLVNQPVDANVVLARDDIDEAENLLRSAIKHWGALRETTPDGLRGSFLLRAGKLSRRNDNEWFLQVESESFDILLGQLPWGISVVRLPWMECTLMVEWNGV